MSSARPLQFGSRARPRVPRTARSLGGFRRWVTSGSFPEPATASWIRGEVLVDVSPEALDSHNDAKTEITSVLRGIARDEELGQLHGDRVLLTNASARLSTEPDVLFLSFDAIQSGRVQFRAKANRRAEAVEVLGVPDLVVEVVSDSSVRKDTILLREAYARAGIPEYWIVDSRGRLQFEVLVLRNGVYRRSRHSPVFGRTFTLTRSKNRVGRWTHRLRWSRA